MKALIIVNTSPWGTTRSLSALDFARAWIASGRSLPAVFFRGEAAYTALAGTVADAGTPELTAAWAELATGHGTELLVCSAAAARRLPDRGGASMAPGYRLAGLVEIMERVAEYDRLVSF